jgi:hypothetical protein
MVAFKKKGWSFLGADRWTQCVSEGYMNFGAEKCHINGTIRVKRGTGRFHIGLGANNLGAVKRHSHDLSGVTSNHSLSHRVAKFQIGRIPPPDFDPPLDDIEVSLESVDRQDGFWSVLYFVHIVPSSFRKTSGIRTETFRYTAMYSQKLVKPSSLRGLPGIHVYYDFTPMKVLSIARSGAIGRLTTHLAGLIGGAFSFAAIIDAVMFGALSTLEGKRLIGKDV